MAEPKPIFVVDASVIVKWIINHEEDLEQALLLKSDFNKLAIEIKVPTHCFPEICNVIGRQQADLAVSFISYLIASDMEECQLTVDLASTAFKFIKKYKTISFYDALYHALALQKSGVFLTADEKYYKKAGREGHIMLLKDYGKKR